ncbi:major facilitator superfamily transporter [Phialemonium atrogriseum]|uniref:Major facilitator superfamily transporter n=1 Tax=Phialemonium atrogriseum TaxID=1093897 RepID=A0AAJ0C9I9_9PEZI|nr:major facilitator superfamily transporter [Phialemonium atrogriseum]KAK1771423.1 major facilitator superfamily transporter [Phialemonium atrogriseum]
MGLGILEDNVMKDVPGTTRYFDDPERPQYAIDGEVIVTGLKCDTSGPVPIILVPQPSDDPNDPLNWPLWKRDLITFILSVTAIFATSLGPILAANTVTLSFWFKIPFGKAALLTGYFLLGVGVAGFVFVPSGRIWGKRHLFILGTIILIASSAWSGGCAPDRNYTCMLWSRIFQGIGAAPFESFVNAAVGDLYFVHQRGIRMAFTNLAVFGGAFFTPILVGKITHSLNWWWTFYLVSIFCTASLIAIILFCPETAYVRSASLNLDLVARENEVETEAKTRDDRTSADWETTTLAAPAADNGGNQVASAPREQPKPTLWRWLALFNGRKTDEQFWKLLLRPLVMLLQPAFLWASLIQGTMIGWTVFIGVTLAQFTIATPLWWNEVKTGYAYVGPFVGALLGFAIAGGLADWSAKALTRRNGGVYEPEFRILLVIPQLILGGIGLYGWGITADGMLLRKYNVVVPLTFFGLEVAGMVIGAVASSLYIVDAYRDLAIEGFTCMIIFKNLFSFALTFKAYDWLIENQTHARPLFNIIGSVQVGICLTSIPMYIYGKRIRSYFHRNDLLDRFNLR